MAPSAAVADMPDAGVTFTVPPLVPTTLVYVQLEA
jgi:hypothetical protein